MIIISGGGGGGEAGVVLQLNSYQKLNVVGLTVPSSIPNFVLVLKIIIV